MSEKQLHQQLVKLLNAYAVPHCRARMDRRATMTVGWPDFSFPFRGRFVGWEAKTGTKLSKEQAAIREGIERHGGAYKVITNLGEAQEHLLSLCEEVGK
jgi:hypothetical protein